MIAQLCPNEGTRVVLFVMDNHVPFPCFPSPPVCVGVYHDTQIARDAHHTHTHALVPRVLSLGRDENGTNKVSSCSVDCSL